MDERIDERQHGEEDRQQQDDQRVDADKVEEILPKAIRGSSLKVEQKQEQRPAQQQDHPRPVRVVLGVGVRGPHDDGHSDERKYGTDRDLEQHQQSAEPDVAQVEGVALGEPLVVVFVVHDQHPAVAETAAGGFVAADQGAAVFGKVLRHGCRHVDGLWESEKKEFISEFYKIK